MRSTQAAVLGFFIFVLSLLAGCSSRPSESEVRQLIQQQITSNANGLIALTGFRKTNGVEQVASGMKIYTMEWEADIEFTADCVWNKADFSAVLPPKGIDWLLNLDKQRATKGMRLTLPGSTTLRKTENGWRPGA